MKQTEIEKWECKKVLDMYYETRKVYTDLVSVDKFCEDFLARCECCGEIHYWEDLHLHKNWDGKTLDVCKECTKEMME